MDKKNKEMIGQPMKNTKDNQLSNGIICCQRLKKRMCDLLMNWLLCCTFGRVDQMMDQTDVNILSVLTVLLLSQVNVWLLKEQKDNSLYVTFINIHKIMTQSVQMDGTSFQPSGILGNVVISH